MACIFCDSRSCPASDSRAFSACLRSVMSAKVEMKPPPGSGTPRISMTVPLGRTRSIRCGRAWAASFSRSRTCSSGSPGPYSPRSALKRMMSVKVVFSFSNDCREIEQFGEAPVPAGEPQAGIEDADAFAHVVEGVAQQSRFARQRFFGVFSIGDVSRENDKPGLASGFDGLAGDGQLEPADALGHAQPDLPAVRHAGLMGLAQRRQRDAGSIFRHHVADGFTEQTRCRRHKQTVADGMEVEILPIEAYLEHQVRNRGQCGVQLAQ